MSKLRTPTVSVSSAALAAGLAIGLAAAQTPSPAPPPASTAAEGDETVVVTGNRLGIAQRRDLLGTAISVLTRAQLEVRQTRFVSDVLRDVPGVAVNRTGTVGGLTQVRMRGAEGNHTLVLLDGADISDPFQGEFDFAGLLAADIARIEVLRGEQSALYGSDAIGGVINIIPRRAADDWSAGGMAEFGRYSTFQSGLHAGYGGERSDVFLSVSHYGTSGINISRFGGETDGARNTSAFLNAGFKPIPQLELRGLLRYVETYAETDPQDFAFPARPTQGLVIDGDNTSSSRQYYGALSAELSLLDGRWVTKASYAFADVARKSFTNGLPSFFTDGTRNRLSLISAFAFDTGAAQHRLTGGVDWKRETYLNVATGTPGPANRERVLENTGFVLAYDLTWGGFGFGAAYRFDKNDRFRNAETWRVQASYLVEDWGTRVRASAGTGIKAPTNFELFGFNPTSFIGNPDLLPEKSVGFDIGIEQSLVDGRIRAGITYFEAELENEIFTAFLPGFISSPRNRTTLSPRSGVELTLDARLDESWSVNAAYTWLEAEEAGLEEVRRPPQTGSLAIAYRTPDGRGSAALTIRYNGEQLDNEFINATPQTRVTLAAYTLVNFNASFEVSPGLTLYGRVENLLGEEYEEVFSFRTQGRAAYLGVRAEF